MGLQPSASRTGLLLACPRPFHPDTPTEYDPPGEPSRYGSAFHQVIATCLRAGATGKDLAPGAYAKAIDAAAALYDVKRSADELAGHVRSSYKFLRSWLTREGLNVVHVEKAYAIEPFDSGAAMHREIKPHDENHRYDVRHGEIPGTVDLIVESAGREREVVIDHKTGYVDTDFALPTKIPQMRTLGQLGNEVGIFHADRHGLPSIYVEPFEPEEANEHVRALSQALALVGSGFMRPGPECNGCPVREGCPAHTADILAQGTAALVHAANTVMVEPVDPQAPLVAPANGSTVASRAGALYELLKRFRALEGAASDEIKRLVRAGHIIETRGGTLTLQEQSFETLSKKSVLEALGKVAGEKALSQLRKKGAMRETTRQVIQIEKDRGR